MRFRDFWPLLLFLALTALLFATGGMTCDVHIGSTPTTSPTPQPAPTAKEAQ